jgi:ABC-type multidrug transport system ATPase subunit
MVTDYSAGMRKKITLATALLHTPRLLVLDEPFEAIDPVSAATIRVILGASSTPAGRWCCPAMSWPWSSRSATTWA